MIVSRESLAYMHHIISIQTRLVKLTIARIRNLDPPLLYGDTGVAISLYTIDMLRARPGQTQVTGRTPNPLPEPSVPDDRHESTHHHRQLAY